MKINTEKISEREKEVIIFKYKGLNYNRIAEQMNISPATVRKHTENIYKKFDVHNKVEVIHKVLR
ncbi:MAG: hypothetical protein COW67_11985 [Flavobacteriales bacterium CG18_big_fil_WC_8_21_14_2_50_32_9]|nr:response regulator transcription factor [Flavobacteriales bacterium]PIQ14787.1 MAG: hypothetical protein COW67_11985 [Flavobacteriales bacterium CG18_big_fil_WC_8_21_14_2_50_32_9]PJC63142.1 MAG: hypothetical protein CO022_00825 [Flavobacteriales bacterium CG_4_9_14_0_2_um_filter_32_27]